MEYAADLEQNTDESNCLPNEWPCETFYSKYDQLWNCPDGRDELGCSLSTRSSLYCNKYRQMLIILSSGHAIVVSMFDRTKILKDSLVFVLIITMVIVVNINANVFLSIYK